MLQVELPAFVPRILHTRLVHGGKEADVSLLQGEGRLEAHVLQSLGTNSRAIRIATRLFTLYHRLASRHFHGISTSQLPHRPRLIIINRN